MVNRLAQRSIALACIGAPFIWVTFEFVRAHLPEISFPWNLLGYPASANLALLQLTSITGIYGLSFLVAAFNAARDEEYAEIVAECGMVIAGIEALTAAGQFRYPDLGDKDAELRRLSIRT